MQEVENLGCLSLFFQSQSQGAEEQLGLDLVPMWNDSIVGSGRTCYRTMSFPESVSIKAKFVFDVKLCICLYGVIT